jgi:hypothetical protein
MIIIIQFLLIFSFNTRASTDINTIRTKYYSAIENENECEKLFKELELVQNNSGLLKAYYAATTALMAKHSWSPATKISYVNKSQELFSEAILKSPKIIEIRYLRLQVENNTPAILNLSKHLESDKKYLKENFETFVKEIGKIEGKKVLDFFQHYKLCSIDEYQNMKKWIL